MSPFSLSFFSLHCTEDKSTSKGKFSFLFGRELIELHISVCKFFTHVQFLHFDYLCLNKISWPIASYSSQTTFCQMKHYARLSGIIINTYPAAELLFVMSNLTLTTLKPKANIVMYSKETSCMHPKLLIIMWSLGTLLNCGLSENKPTKCSVPQTAREPSISSLWCPPGTRNRSWGIAASSPAGFSLL